MNNTKTAVLTDEEIRGITSVTRSVLPSGGFRFVDQRGNILRGTATRPYSHMAIQRSAPYTSRVAQIDGTVKVTEVPASLSITFHSSPKASKIYKTYTIERIVPVTE